MGSLELTWSAQLPELMRSVPPWGAGKWHWLMARSGSWNTAGRKALGGKASHPTPAGKAKRSSTPALWSSKDVSSSLRESKSWCP